MNFYQRLRDLREDADLKQKDVAEIINTSTNYYGDYENGKRDVPTERMLILADYYKVSMDYITGRTNDKGGLHKLNEDEQELIDLFNSLNFKNRYRILGQMSEMLRQQEENAKRKEIA